jgi:O-antigen ligase
MGYALFILVNLTLFVRPAEIVPELESAPIYLLLILPCLAISIPRILQTVSTVGEQPITICVLGLWMAAILSHLARADFFSARDIGGIFGRIVLYYFLLVSLIDSPGRLRQFLAWILCALVLMAGLAVLKYHDLLALPGMKVIEERRMDKETGEEVIFPRLCGSGIFNDPNDVCLALTMGTVISLYFLSDRRAGSVRFLCVPALILFAYTLRLTQSRGGLLGLFTALLILSAARFGWRKTLLPALALLPVTLLLMGGRQASMNLEGGDTGQERIKLWAEGMALFQKSPVFGIGTGQFSEECGLVAHNSFVHTFTEMGFMGGAMFTGMFFLGIWPLVNSDQPQEEGGEELERVRPFLMALVGGYAGGLWSLSRAYVEVTYMVVGLAQVYLLQTATVRGLPLAQEGVIKKIGLVGMVTFLILYLITRTTVVWG